MLLEYAKMQNHSKERKIFQIGGKLHYILDTYAWIEYFIGSEKGLKVKRIVENDKNTLSTPESCICEIKLWCLIHKEDFKKLFNVVKIGSFIEPINSTNWVDATDIRQEKRKTMKDFGLMDSIILAKQKEISGKIVSGDPHFKNQKEVEFIS